MSVKSSISLTNQQDAFARSLVKSGRYSSLSSVLQQGLELLRQKTEAETVETEALRELLQRRLKDPMTFCRRSRWFSTRCLRPSFNSTPKSLACSLVELSTM